MTSRRFFLLIKFGLLFFCVCIFSAGCARKPYVAPRAALDYGQFVLRELPPEVDVSALEGKRIVIDPGHGGAFAGAVGPNNLREADVNLGVGLYLWGMLNQAGAEAYLTRMDDSNVYQGDGLTLKKDLQARAEFAQAREADLFVSLHHNADVLPGAKKNSLETYFKMDDPGPSLDVAKYIHRQLAVSLGQTDNAIYAGNFHVLRENFTTAVLGEPSYISHADNAFRLGLAPFQRIEAQAYFLGIAEYFSKGVPEIGDITPEGIINENPRPLIATSTIADRGVAIDPNSIRVLVDGEAVEAEFDQGNSRITYLPAKRLSNDKHRIRVSLRNINGNAARPKENGIEIAMPPSYVVLESNFQTVRPGSSKPVRLSARVFDTDLMPVADGTPVEFNVTGGSVSPTTSLTVEGEALAYLVPGTNPGLQEIVALTNVSGLSHTLKVMVSEEAPELFVAKLLDARTNRSVDSVLGSVDGIPVGYSDRAGYFALSIDEGAYPPIIFSRQGYITQEARPSGQAVTETVKLRPVANGVLFGKRFAIDPQFGGQEKGAIGPTGVRASDLNLLLAEFLAHFLHASGASVVLTRESDKTVNGLQRVEVAEEFGSELFISINHGDESEGVPENENVDPTEIAGPVSVLHYPTSEDGKRLALTVANALTDQEIGGDIAIGPSSALVLTHTSSPAVIVTAPSPSTPEIEEELRHPGAVRKEAYAIYCGVLEYFGLNNENTGKISLKVIDNEGNALKNAVVTLDGAFILGTDSEGECTYSRLMPGEHSLEMYAHGLRVWAGTIPVQAGQASLGHISLRNSTVTPEPVLKQ